MTKFQFILGPRGQKKSDFIYDKIIEEAQNNPNKNYYFIVPEQDTLNKQNKIIRHPKNKNGINFNIDVLSFNRLCYKVFSELGIKEDEEKILDDISKFMLLRKIVNDLDEKGEIVAFKKVIKKPSFINKLNKLVSEFSAYRIEKQDIENVVNTIDKEKQDLKNKIEEIGKIFFRFTSILDERGLHTIEDKFDLLYKTIDLSNILNDAVVVFDGFTGFTPIQRDIFSKVIMKTSQCFITVDIDLDFLEKRQNPKKEDVFYLSERFIYDVEQELEKSSIIKDDDIIINDKNNIQNDNVIIRSASNAKDEVKYIVNEICGLIKKGYCYKDIYIIAADLDGYSQLFEREFTDKGIKHFIDSGENILNSPYVESLRAAFNVILTNFSYEQVMRYVNAGLIDKDTFGDQVKYREKDIVYIFDNFVREKGIKYDKWKKDFEVKLYDNSNEDILDNKYNDPEEYTENIEALNNLRREIIEPLFDFKEELSKCKDTASYVKAVRTFINKAKLDDKFNSFINGKNDKNKLSYIENSDKVVDSILKKMEELSGEIMINNFEDFVSVFDTVISCYTNKVIPYSQDVLCVGDIMHSRMDNPKVLFFAGFSSTNVPKKQNDNSIINDELRELFKKCNVELSQDTLETTLNQRFYVYLALNSPTEKLYLTYPKKGFDNEKCDISILLLEEAKKHNQYWEEKDSTENISENEKENNKEKKEKIDKDNNDVKKDEEMVLSIPNISIKDLEIYSNRDKCDYISNFCQDLLRDQNKMVELLKELTDEDLEALRNAFIEYQKDFNNEHKEDALIKLNSNELYKSKETFSVSQIETFFNCPYKYFINYGLGLKERKEYGFSNLDRGNILHFVLQRFFKDGDIKIDDFKNEEGKNKINDKFENCCNDILDRYAIFEDSNIKEFQKEDIKIQFKEAIEAIAYQMGKAEFNVLETESEVIERKEIKKWSDEICHYDIKGKIDRIDIYNDKDTISQDGNGSHKELIQIIDYKSSAKEIKEEEIIDGIKLQLIYYLCMKNADDKIPGASLYFNLNKKKHEIEINDNVSKYINKTNDEIKEEIKTDVLNTYKMQGIVNTKYYDDKKSEIIVSKGKKGNEKNIYKDTDQLKDLMNIAQGKIKEGMQNTIDGKIGVNPYMKNGNNACDYCKYKSICRYMDKITKDEEE